MTKVQKLIFAALCAAIAAPQIAGAQTNGGTTVGGLSAGPALPGYSSVVAAPAKKGLRPKWKLPEAAGTSHLCFEPGIGWQIILAPAAGNGGPALGNGVAGRTAGGKSTSSGIAKSAFAQPSGEGPTIGNACPETFSNIPAPGAQVGSRAQSITPTASKGISAGIHGGPRSHSANNSAGFGNIGGGISGPGVIPATGAAPTAGTRILGMQSPGLKSKAHVSRLELRRMIWDAPDLETRMRLRKQLKELDKKPAHSAGASRNGRSHGEDRRGKHGNKGDQSVSDGIYDPISQP